MTSSMRAVVHMVLDRELILIAQMREVATTLVPYRSITQVRADALLLQPGRRKIA